MIDQGNAGAKQARNQNKPFLKLVLGVSGIFVLLCGLLALGIIYIFGRSYFGPKVQIILEPDPSQLSTVTPSDLETAAEILTARCRSLGYAGVSFVVTENNQIVGQVPASTDVEAILTLITRVGLLEFVDFGTAPPDTGTRVQTDFEYPYFPPAEGTRWHTIMTNDEVDSVDLTNDSIGRNAISFTLTSNGTQIFSDFTTNNVGRYLGIVLDKVVVAAPVISSPITEGTALIQSDFTEEEARAFAAYLRAKGPLPFPLVVKQAVINDK